MALSEYRQAVLDSLNTDEERAVIDRFYKMSNQDFQKSYRHNMGELIDRFDRTRLRDYQKDNIRHRSERLKKLQKGFITTLPAGAGKTEIFTQTILENAMEVTEGDKVKLITPPAVILVPSEDLIKQTYLELKERAPNLMVGVDYGKRTDIQPLTISTYETFVAKVEEGKIKPGDVNFIVMDEGHRGLSDTRLNVFRRFLNNTLIDSYSASPAFDAMKNLYELLGKESVIPGPSDRELTNMGYLAECHNVLLRVSVKSEDLPPELLNNPERYNDFLEELKIQAAKEFYLTYVDSETGQQALGKPGVAFTRYVRHAQRASEVFDEALREHAKSNRETARMLDQYTHPTQVLSRSMGDQEVESAFNRILPAHKRTKNEGDNLLTFTTKMAREGTNIPRWKVALGIQTPNSSVDQVQTRGRARRKTGDELSFVLDVFVEEDGIIRGKPRFYYEAIDDPSIVRGVVTVTLDKEQIEAIAGDTLEFKNKKEMKELVLNGNATGKASQAFDKLWDEVLLHVKQHKASKPYLLDNEPVAYKIHTRNQDDENGKKEDGKLTTRTELRISEKAVDQFRAALGIPGQLNSKWHDAASLQDVVIGKLLDGEREEDREPGHAAMLNHERAKHYEGKFRALLRKAEDHFAQEGHKKHPKPFFVGDQSIRMEERLNEHGSLVLGFHASAAHQFKQALDVVPCKTRRFNNEDEFTARVLEGADYTPALKRGAHALWQQAEAEYKKTRQPGIACKIDFCDTRVEAARCLSGPNYFEFCLDRRAIGAARKELGIAEITYDPNTIKWEKSVAAIERINKQRDGIDTREKPWEPKYLLVRNHLKCKIDSSDFIKLWEKFEAACPVGTEKEVRFKLNNSFEVELGRSATNGGGGDLLFVKATPEAVTALRDHLNLRDRRDGLWTGKKAFAADIFKIAPRDSKFSQLWDKFEKACPENSPDVEYTLNDTALTLGWRAVSGPRGGRKYLCVYADEEAVAAIGKEIGIAEVKQHPWMKQRDITVALRVTATRERSPKFYDLWDAMDKACPAGSADKKYEVTKGRFIEIGRSKAVKAGGNVLAVRATDEAIQTLEDYLGLSRGEQREKPWATRSNFAADYLQVDNKSLDELWPKLEKTCPEGSPDKTFTLSNSEKITLGRTSDTKGRGNYLAVKATPEAVKAVRSELGLLEKRTDPWVTKALFAEKLGIDRGGKYISQLWDYLESHCPAGSQDKTISLPNTNIQIELGRGAGQQGTRDFLHVNANKKTVSDVKTLIDELRASRIDLEDRLSNKKPTHTQPRSIKPTSPHIRDRTGRSRAVSDDE